MQSLGISWGGEKEREKKKLKGTDKQFQTLQLCFVEYSDKN
jgi:hypothetical protein